MLAAVTGPTCDSLQFTRNRSLARSSVCQRWPPASVCSQRALSSRAQRKKNSVGKFAVFSVRKFGKNEYRGYRRDLRGKQDKPARESPRYRVRVIGGVPWLKLFSSRGGRHPEVQGWWKDSCQRVELKSIKSTYWAGISVQVQEVQKTSKSAVNFDIFWQFWGYVDKVDQHSYSRHLAPEIIKKTAYRRP